jgi:hypothetical protein
MPRLHDCYLQWSVSHRDRGSELWSPARASRGESIQNCPHFLSFLYLIIKIHSYSGAFRFLPILRGGGVPANQSTRRPWPCCCSRHHGDSLAASARQLYIALRTNPTGHARKKMRGCLLNPDPWTTATRRRLHLKAPADDPRAYPRLPDLSPIIRGGQISQIQILSRRLARPNPSRTDASSFLFLLAPSRLSVVRDRVASDFLS